MPTDTQVNDLKINVLSEAQYEQIQSPSDTELYLVPETVDTTPTSGSTNPITSGGVYNALQNIPEQEQSDWSETDATDPAYIKNKPQNIVTDAGYVHTDNNYTTTEKSKLASIEEGAEVNVQSDWNQSNNTKDDYIKNKPNLAEVATSGDYDDLTNKPTIPTVPTHRTINHEQITDSSLGNANLHDGFYFPNAVQDFDGNWYGAVVIGDQVWLGENLRTTHLADGTEINAGNASGTELTYKNYTSHPLPIEKRGLLYSYQVVNSASGVILQNWKSPSSGDFETLKNYIEKQNRYSLVAKSLASTEGWENSDVVNAVGNNMSLNNGSGLNLYPSGSYGASGETNSGNCILWATKSSNLKTCLYLTTDSTEYTTASYNYSSLMLAIRLVSVFTPQQFRAWYVKTYGSLQHNIHQIGELSDVEYDYEGKYIPNALTDYDGNSYGAVILGDQVWMAENLRTTHYADGTAVTYKDNASSQFTLKERGYFYLWSTVMRNASASTSNPSGIQGIAPTGWHIPSQAEFQQLTNYLSQNPRYWAGNVSTNIAKSLSSKYGWNESETVNAVGYNQQENNTSSFNAIPAGNNSGSPANEKNYAVFMTTTENSSEQMVPFRISKNSVEPQYTGYAPSIWYLNVRCVYDGTPEQFIRMLMNKQVLVYDASKQMWVNKKVAETLPSMSGNSGKVMAVNDTETDVEWVRPVTVYSGSSEPSASLGSDGDIYIQTVS